MLGIKLEQYLIQQRARLAPSHAKEVINLGVAGMLHDIGVAGLPEPLRAFSRINLPEDLAMLDEWATHPQRGYDMIKGGVEATAAAAVLHHHQHYDGSGFPSMPAKPGDEPRNSGQRIHIFSRILAIADLYDRLTIGPENRRRPNFEILPFPPGMRVTLNDGTEAVTVGLRADRPYQPLVKRIERRDPFTLASETLDLTVEKGLEIEKVAGVSAKGMIPPPPPAPAARKAQAGSSLASASA
jgi:hypothetical protein